MKTELQILQDNAQLLVAQRHNFDALMVKYVTSMNRLEANQNSIKLLIVQFQGRADGFAKLSTEKGNAISNEYLSIISDIQHSVDLS